MSAHASLPPGRPYMAPKPTPTLGRRRGWSCPRTGKVPYLIRAPNKVADQKHRRAHGLAKCDGTLAPSGLLDAHLQATSGVALRVAIMR